MDKTEDWIMMCEKAEELQKGHIFVPGDYKSYDGIASLIESYDSYREYYLYPYHIWLPTQDQLQDMVKNRNELWIHTLNRFHEYYTEEALNNHEWCFIFDTPEKMWLAFVIKEKYSKIWDGNDWIPETTH